MQVVAQEYVDKSLFEDEAYLPGLNIVGIVKNISPPLLEVFGSQVIH